MEAFSASSEHFINIIHVILITPPLLSLPLVSSASPCFTWIWCAGSPILAATSQQVPKPHVVSYPSTDLESRGQELSWLTLSISAPDTLAPENDPKDQTRRSQISPQAGPGDQWQLCSGRPTD